MMRDQNGLLNSFVPQYEKDWDARLYIDEAIKSQAEYHLQTIARALSGKHDIRLNYADKDKPIDRTQHIEGDDGTWIKKTTKHLIEARMDSFVFYGNDITQIWIQVIDFWIGKKMIWPCGGAAYPNRAKNLEQSTPTHDH
jgi:hypothetical protein